MGNIIPKSVKDLGEFPLIDRIRNLVAATPSPELIKGIGDDTAVIKLTEDRLLLATMDCLVEDVHFRWKWTSAHDIGRKALAVNLSDIASMGGRPIYALVSLVLPNDMPLKAFDDFYRGLGEEAGAHGVLVAGGNLARSPGKLVVDVCLLGEVAPDHLLTREGAKPGDRLFVTGTLGSSAMGLWLLERYGNEVADEFLPLIHAHRRPTARVVLGQVIARSGIATSMIDISDGLAADLTHLCDSGGVGVELIVEHIPLPPGMDAACRAIEAEALPMALLGGEDYELLFTVSGNISGSIYDHLPEDFRQLRITELGLMTPDKDGRWVIDRQKGRARLTPDGWSHFG